MEPKKLSLQKNKLSGAECGAKMRDKLTLPPVGLGMWDYGGLLNPDHSRDHSELKAIEQAISLGYRHFDTAEMYAAGHSEELLGRALKGLNRSDFIITSKVKPENLSYRGILTACDGSLRKLQTDYIDLYQLHWPDRALNIFGGGLGLYKHYDLESIPIEETLEVLEEIVKTGKVRHIGLSNETPWGLSEFLNVSEKKSYPRAQSVQNAYNLLNRNYETGMSEFFHRSEVGLLAYSPLAQGYLSGKYLDGKLPEGSRTKLFGRGQRYETPSAESAIR